ncbi:septal ring lytic transglycosylase RlpA family protein [Thiothrix winogradskyi]|uniref:Endolytic peptidoglycan transglycosylase RlpA n=1 Tax=Thiothrix winogradskyi TaxID=96472 RepID=A0ABY3T0F5_9GAMM|nr:septal ring lytic transglycosylase RlpA family protein [Thiothrix winogradskyi]UJS24888.1 septal ring lytic transglycosylase RlpA family protein [Thiothrix winogradskyi]
MKIQQPKWSGWTRSISIGLTTLALAVTFSLPAAALAKEKAPSAKVSKQKSAKAASHKAVKAKAKLKAKTKASKPTKKRLLSKKRQQSSQVVWNNAHESKQAYYIMPESLGGKVATPQAQPDYIQVSAHQRTADTSPPARTTKTPAKSHQVGTASFYSDKFHGRKTASGERFDQNDLTCAHGSLPFGCRIRVTNLRNNKTVEVKVNDRGGFHKHGRVIDLSKAAAKEIGMVSTGTAKVKVEVLE